MSRLFYHTCQDNAGNLLFDVSGTMRLAGSGTLATIYGDEALTVILPNPMTNHPSFGSFKCYLGPGVYDFYLARAGYTFETLTGVQGHGTMAQQDAANVAITGGSVVATYAALASGVRLGDSAFPGLPLDVVGSGRLTGTLAAQTGIRIGDTVAPISNMRLQILHRQNSVYGLSIAPVDTDTGSFQAAIFQNLSAGIVGSIATTATATAFNTSSDGRLKHAIAPLTGALDVVRRLRPISHRWRADDSPGVGFLAHEVQAVVEGVVTGTPDAVDAEGHIQPMQIDHSKLVPWLTAAIQALSQQVEALTARLDAVGG